MRRAFKIQDAVKELKVSDYLEYQSFLTDLYNLMKTKNSPYNYMMYAEDLGFNATTAAHQLVRGHRALSEKNGVRIADALKFKAQERKYFLDLIEFNNAKRVQSREEAFADLVKQKQKMLSPEDQEQLQFYAEWQHPVIREMLSMPLYAGNPQRIADDLLPHLEEKKVQESIDLLQSLGLISYDDETKAYKLANQRFSTGARIKGMASASYHRQMMQLAVDSLAKVKGPERDFSAITVTVDQEKAERLKAMIHNFQLELLREAESTTDPDRTVQINIQLFPLSKRRAKS